MAYSLEQLMPRARETARQMVAALRQGRLVASCIDGYVAEWGRASLLANPAEYRELQSKLLRESLLAMCARANAELPRRIARRPVRKLAGIELQLADAFRAEFFLYLAKEFRWSPDELDDFWRDLDFFTAMSQAGTKKARQGEHPFIDRCALLLDPALFEHARSTAEKYLGQLENTAAQIIKNIFVPRRAPGGLFE